jgi:type IV pilus assembly protein PilO
MNKMSLIELRSKMTPFLVGLLVIALGYSLIIQKRFKHYDYLKAQEIILKAAFESKQHKLHSLLEYNQQINDLKERVQLMLNQFPKKNEIPGLLGQISKTGLASGLKFELFAPHEEIEHDFYVELPISLTVVGNYFQLAVFLSRIAELDRIVTLHQVCIERPSLRDKFGEELVMNIVAKIYRYPNS